MIKLQSFYFMRHGQTDHNIGINLDKTTDIPLNEVGIMQTTVAAKLLLFQDVKIIFTSPSLRALQTAKILQKTLLLPVIEVNEFAAFTTNDSVFEQRVFNGFRNSLNLSKGVALIVAHACVYSVIQRIVLNSAQIETAENGVPIYHEWLGQETIWKIKKIK